MTPMDHAITIKDLLLIILIPGALIAAGMGVLAFFASMMSDTH